MLASPLHFELGIVSCVLNIAALLSFLLIIIIKGISVLAHMFMAMIVIAIMWLFTAGFLRLSLEDMGIKKIVFVEPWMLIVPGVLMLIALGFGIAGLMQNEHEKFFATVGCLFSIGGLLSIFGTIHFLH